MKYFYGFDWWLPISLTPDTITWDSIMWSSLCRKKSWNFVSIFWWHLKGGMETPQNDFQIYRPINDTWQAVFSLEGDIAGGISKNRFRTITLDWSVLRTWGQRYGSINLKIVLWGLHTTLQVPPKELSKIPTFVFFGTGYCIFSIVDSVNIYIFSTTGRPPSQHSNIGLNPETRWQDWSRIWGALRLDLYFFNLTVLWD